MRSAAPHGRFSGARRHLAGCGKRRRAELSGLASAAGSSQCPWARSRPAYTHMPPRTQAQCPEPSRGYGKEQPNGKDEQRRDHEEHKQVVGQRTPNALQNQGYTRSQEESTRAFEAHKNRVHRFRQGGWIGVGLESGHDVGGLRILRCEDWAPKGTADIDVDLPRFTDGWLSGLIVSDVVSLLPTCPGSRAPRCSVPPFAEAPQPPRGSTTPRAGNPSRAHCAPWPRCGARARLSCRSSASGT